MSTFRTGMRGPFHTLVTLVVSHGPSRARARRVRAAGLLALAMTAAACAESPTSPSETAGANGAPGAAATTSGSTSTSSTTGTSTGKPTQEAQMGYSLRFSGSASSDVDRVKIPIDPQVVADVGRDFTIDFWVKAEPGANATSTCQAGSDGWTYGNVLLDRDVVEADGDYGEYGVSVGGGRIAFGVGRGGRTQTLCGLIDVADGRWHHVALTRRASDGQMRIYVDGTESAQGVGPAGDISYRDGRPTASPQDPFLVLGASKRDGGEGSQGFTGYVDELRISTRIRYQSPFDRPPAAFTADADTALLLHFDEGPTGPCASTVTDTSGKGTHAQCRHGGNGAPGPLYTLDVPFTPAPARQSRTWLLGNQPGAPGATSQPTQPAPLQPGETTPPSNPH
jgi:Concanavalin A-like lectin/glucanases superfamily